MAILNDLLVNGISRFIGGVIMSATNVTSSTTYYPVLATGTSTSLFVDTNKSGLSFTKVDGTTGVEGTATLTLGNTTASGTAGNATGQLRLLDYYGYAATIRPGESHSAAVQFYLPNWTGSVERLVSMPTPSTQVGGTSTPVYVDAKGHVTVCTSVMSHTHNLGITTGTSSDTSQITLSHGTKYVLSAGGSTYCFTMPSGGGTGTVTGTGISGYLAKWTGASGQTSTELTAGPMIGSGVKQFLREDGNWAKPFASQIYMGWCDTARATAAKTVTLDSSFELVADTMIMIRFANGNSAASPTLNINSLGAKNITFNSQSLNNSVLPSAMAPNTYLILQYTGSSWTVMSGYNNYVLMSPYMCNVDRVTSLNRSYSQPIVEYLLATSSTTTGKPPIDAHVLSLNWDNSNVYAAQLAVANGSSVVATPGRIFSRGQLGTAATWSDWLEVPRLSGALTNNQIVVSDESTGTALLKGGPTIGTGTTKFLREDGTWQVPSGGSGGVEGIFKGTCSTAAATVEKAVTCPEFTSSDLVTGAVVFVTFTETNGGAVADIKLNVNSTGAKNIRFLTNAAVTTLPSAGYIIANMTYRFVYNGTYWVMDLYYNTNDNAYVVRNYYMNRYTGSQAVSPYKIMLVDGGGHYIPYTTATGTSTYTKAPNTTPFNPFAGIYFHYANSTISANSKPANAEVWYMYSYGYADIRYSFNINSSGTAGTTALTANKPVYIRAKYDFATGMATLAPGTSTSNYLEASAIVQDLPTSNPNSGDDFYIYIFMGYAYDKYRATLELFNEVYAWNSIQNAITPFQGAPFNGSGTFTLTDMSSSTNTMTLNYVKQGRLVTISGELKQTVSLSFGYNGLPFPAAYAQYFNIAYINTLGSVETGIINISSSSINMYGYYGGGTTSGSGTYNSGATYLGTRIKSDSGSARICITYVTNY